MDAEKYENPVKKNKVSNKSLLSIRFKPGENYSSSHYDINEVEKTIKIKKENKTIKLDNIFYDGKVRENINKNSNIFDNTTKNILDNFINENLNSAIITYGLPNAVRKYTFQGELNSEKDEDKGIVFRSFDYIFENKNRKQNIDNTYYLGIVQIYEESVKLINNRFSCMI